MKSLRWSSRTLSKGLLDVTVMPSHLPPRTSATEAGPLPSTTVVPRCQQYYGPLGLPPGTNAISPSAYRRRFVRRGRPGRASPVPYQAVAACPPPYPGDVLHPSGLADAVCCLRRDMIGSAIPSLSGFYVTGLQGSLDVGPAALLPSQEPYSSLRALDAPLGHGDLAPRLEPATRRSGAYRGGTLTHESDTA